MYSYDPFRFLRASMVIRPAIRLTKPLLRLMHLDRLGNLFTESSSVNGIEFIDALLSKLDISYEVSDEDLSRIPATGPFIVVANHPFGGLDDLILLRIFSSVRPDFRIFTNPILKKCTCLDDYILPGTAFSSFGRHESSRKELLSVAHHLKSGGCIGIFPSGRVSGYDIDANRITDAQWRSNVLRFMRSTEVPVVPVYFRGSNSLLFQMLGMVMPALQSIKLPSELLNKKNSAITLRIGKPIPPKEMAEYRDISRYGRYLRAKTYALGTSLEVKKFFTPVDERLPLAEEIISPIPAETLTAEVHALLPERLLFEVEQFSVYCAPASELPSVILEIGRLREETFRLVGEGTNKKIDLDEYDIYYRHLFIWDRQAARIVGAYRLGMGAEIMESYGIKGFYINSLFRISEGFKPALGAAIELGRSFIVQDYQRKPLSLYCLWKGILYFLLKHPKYLFLIGPVSISNKFSDFSRSLIIEYIKKHYFDEEMARYVKPRHEFIPDTGSIDKDILIEGTTDLGKFDKHIRDVEIEDSGMPVLLKKYLSLNGRIIAFNLDPDFNDALDGLLVLDLMNVPMTVINTLSKEIDDASILERFNPGTNAMHR